MTLEEQILEAHRKAKVAYDLLASPILEIMETLGPDIALSALGSHLGFLLFRCTQIRGTSDITETMLEHLAKAARTGESSTIMIRAHKDMPS